MTTLWGEPESKAAFRAAVSVSRAPPGSCPSLVDQLRLHLKATSALPRLLFCPVNPKELLLFAQQPGREEAAEL